MNSEGGKSGSAGIGETVKRFYEELPFNLYSSPEVMAKQLASSNGVLSLVVLDPLIERQTQVLDLGCGTGWLANSIAFHYEADVTGVDIVHSAIQFARKVADTLDVDTLFLEKDLFEYQAQDAFDLVCCNGVLPCVPDWQKALSRLCSLVRANGHLYLGLYHRYMRRPFLDFFKELSDSGATEEELFFNFSRLKQACLDPVQKRSWFRDQVLHPFEVHHTLAEVNPLLRDEGFALVSTSVNGFGADCELDELYRSEPALEPLARERLQQGYYCPGFFVVLAKKT